MKKAVKITVTGKVQNVGFRYYTHKKALELGVNGFVKNQIDGTVYVEAIAEEEVIDTFIGWLYQGPRWARVKKLHIQDIPEFDSDGFSVK